MPKAYVDSGVDAAFESSYLSAFTPTHPHASASPPYYDARKYLYIEGRPHNERPPPIYHSPPSYFEPQLEAELQPKPGSVYFDSSFESDPELTMHNANRMIEVHTDSQSQPQTDSQLTSLTEPRTEPVTESFTESFGESVTESMTGPSSREGRAVEWLPDSTLNECTALSDRNSAKDYKFVDVSAAKQVNTDASKALAQRLFSRLCSSGTPSSSVGHLLNAQRSNVRPVDDADVDSGLSEGAEVEVDLEDRDSAGTEVQTDPLTEPLLQLQKRMEEQPETETPDLSDSSGTFKREFKAELTARVNQRWSANLPDHTPPTPAHEGTRTDPNYPTHPSAQSPTISSTKCLSPPPATLISEVVISEGVEASSPPRPEKEGDSASEKNVAQEPKKPGEGLTSVESLTVADTTDTTVTGAEGSTTDTAFPLLDRCDASATAAKSPAAKSPAPNSAQAKSEDLSVFGSPDALAQTQLLSPEPHSQNDGILNVLPSSASACDVKKKDSTPEHRHAGVQSDFGPRVHDKAASKSEKATSAPSLEFVTELCVSTNNPHTRSETPSKMNTTSHALDQVLAESGQTEVNLQGLARAPATEPKSQSRVKSMVAKLERTKSSGPSQQCSSAASAHSQSIPRRKQSSKNKEVRHTHITHIHTHTHILTHAHSPAHPQL